MRRMEIDKGKPNRNSDSFEALDLSQIPTNAFLAPPFDGLNKRFFGPQISDESESSDEYKKINTSQGSLDAIVKDCFKSQNCITELNPKFMIQTENCTNKLRFEMTEVLFSGIVNSSWEMGEIPDDCMDDL